jgi:methyl-accepting chemotaxis protein
MPNFDTQTVQLIIVAGTACALVVQTIVLLAILVTVRKSARSVHEEIEDLRSAIMPVVFNARDLMIHLTPKIEATADDLAFVAHALRDQTADIHASASEILNRVRQQSIRLDSMVSNVLNAVDRASDFVTDSVGKPVRQVSALLASAKAVIESLRNSEHVSHAQGRRPTGDNDMFI